MVPIANVDPMRCACRQSKAAQVEGVHLALIAAKMVAIAERVALARPILIASARTDQAAVPQASAQPATSAAVLIASARRTRSARRHLVANLTSYSTSVDLLH